MGHETSDAESAIATESLPLKVSFCTTVKNRGHHLAQTLPQNLANNPGPNVEFMILDYGDDDGIEGKSIKEWLLTNYPGEIESGRIRYARTEQEHFRMAHAKNMAHRLATGDVLCNLDADNITGNGFADWLSEKFAENADTLVRVHTRDKFINKVFMGGDIQSLDGRIAISKEKFYTLHGYNEAFQGWGGEDGDFENRALIAGGIHCRLPIQLYGSVLAHSNQERVANFSPEEKTAGERNLTTPPDRVGTIKRILNIRSYDPAQVQSANPEGGFGCGDATVLQADLQEQVSHLMPRVHSSWGERCQRAKDALGWPELDRDLHRGM